MKHTFLGLLVVLFSVCAIGFGTVALAEDYGLSTAAGRAQLPSTIAGQSTLPGVIGKVVQYGLTLIGILFFMLILYAGFLWMSAMGNNEKVEQAKQIMETAITGLILILGAYAITQFVFTGLSGGSGAAAPTPVTTYSCNVDGECPNGMTCQANVCK